MTIEKVNESSVFLKVFFRCLEQIGIVFKTTKCYLVVLVVHRGYWKYDDRGRGTYGAIYRCAKIKNKYTCSPPNILMRLMYSFFCSVGSLSNSSIVVSNSSLSTTCILKRISLLILRYQVSNINEALFLVPTT